jgi:hypothetical protein
VIRATLATELQIGANGGMDPQLVIVGLCLAAAAAWLVWRTVKSFRGQTAAGCGTGCGDCSRREGSDATAKTDGFVPVDQLMQSSPRKG